MVSYFFHRCCTRRSTALKDGARRRLPRPHAEQFLERTFEESISRHAEGAASGHHSGKRMLPGYCHWPDLPLRNSGSGNELPSTLLKES